jgi:flagellar transcriptional activator FlhC
MKRAKRVVNQTRAVVDALPPEYTPESRAYGDQHWATLNWARLALNLGARTQVVERITGIGHGELLRIFFDSSDNRKSPGGFPSSAEWFINANLITAVHATDLYAVFDKLRQAGNPPAEALIKAFEKYSTKYHHDPRLSFDRAFHLICHVDGLWTQDEPELQALACYRCQSIYVAAKWKVARSCDACPMCKLAQRFEASVRVSSRFSPPGLTKLFQVGKATAVS